MAILINIEHLQGFETPGCYQILFKSGFLNKMYGDSFFCLEYALVLQNIAIESSHTTGLVKKH